MSDDWIKSQASWRDCKECPLHKSRKNVVLGRGHIKASVMFVGEGPGKTEDEEGVPFAGPSGDLLNQFLSTFDLPRANVFVDNVVACWPYVVDSSGLKQTRKPQPSEMNACKMRLIESIYTVDPMVIVALGASALQGLTGETGSIVANAGNIFEMSIPGWYIPVRYPVYAMMHPAYLLRQTPPDPKEKKPDERHPIRRTYKHFKDMLETVHILNEAYYGVDLPF
jgi:DNA polymerase